MRAPFIGFRYCHHPPNECHLPGRTDQPCVGYVPATMALYQDIIDLRLAERRSNRS
jgi:hypothetical protein